MAGKGAPEGNKYAQKEESRRGTNFSYWLDAYEKEFIQQALAWEGKEPTIENIRAKAKEWAKQGINEGLKRVFERYKLENSSEQEHG